MSTILDKDLEKTPVSRSNHLIELWQELEERRNAGEQNTEDVQQELILQAYRKFAGEIERDAASQLPSSNLPVFVTKLARYLSEK